MTSLLWGSGIRRETYNSGEPVMIERFAVRPWPVDPAKYPLDAPPKAHDWPLWALTLYYAIAFFGLIAMGLGAADVLEWWLR